MRTSNDSVRVERGVLVSVGVVVSQDVPPASGFGDGGGHVASGSTIHVRLCVKRTVCESGRGGGGD